MKPVVLSEKNMVCGTPESGFAAASESVGEKLLLLFSSSCSIRLATVLEDPFWAASKSALEELVVAPTDADEPVALSVPDPPHALSRHANNKGE